MKQIAILGSTGSIGTQALEVVDSLGDIQVLGLTGNKNIALLQKQIYQYRPQKVAVMDEVCAKQLKENVKSENTQVLSGMDGLIEVATMGETELLLTSVVGNVGLLPTFLAMEAGKNIALANKETLVSGGKLFMDLARKNNIQILPVDSEHSAIFQALQGNEDNPIEKILLTASGGPFFGKTHEDLLHVTVEEALAHPNWSMGKKISIDSATMMNKGLEVIEAKWLFDVTPDQIEVLVHPQSILHSAVAFQDSSVMGQMGVPDMRVPIQYAFTYPRREKNSFPKLSLSKLGMLSFDKPDLQAFPCLSLAYTALEVGGTMPAVLNAANEVAVELFLAKQIRFLEIPYLIEKTMGAYTAKYEYDLEDILQADVWGRDFAKTYYLDNLSTK